VLKSFFLFSYFVENCKILRNLAVVYLIERTIMGEVQARGGTAAINIKLKWGSNPLQWILNGLTWNIWAPTTLTVSGTVIKE
jgi:hypothetical protein